MAVSLVLKICARLCSVFLVTAISNSAAQPIPSDAFNSSATGDQFGASVEVLRSTPSTVPVPAAQTPTFHVRPHPSYPWSVLQIFFEPSAPLAGYRLYRVNYTDLSAADTVAPLPSYALREENPFNIFGLHAGHHYRIEISGEAAESSAVVLWVTTVMTLPQTPSFDAAAVETTTKDITLRGRKAAGALQDYFLVHYSQLEPAQSFPPQNVSDLAEQTAVELFVSGLAAGRNYNLTVTAIRDGVSSRPWQTFATTRPNEPRALRVVQARSAAATLVWSPPVDSGYDSFRVAYRSTATHSAAIKVADIRATSVGLSDGLYPGRSYKFDVVAVKSGEASEPASVTATMRPLAPVAVELQPSLQLVKYVFVVRLPPLDASLADRCELSVASAHSAAVFNVSANVTTTSGAAECVLTADLTPGERYSMRAWAVSGQSFSAALLHATVARPAFDAASFGVQLAYPAPSSLLVLWPTANASQLLLWWRRLVGVNSTLEVRLENAVDGGGGGGLTANGSPLDGASIRFDDLETGACYRVLMYTRTELGVLSGNTSQYFIRLAPPDVDVRVQSVAPSDASLVVRLPLSGIPSGDCQLLLRVKGDGGRLVQNLTLNLSDASSPVFLSVTTLAPYSKYSVEGRVVCAGGAVCPPKTAAVRTLNFATAEGVPSAVRDCRVRATLPYKAELTWLPPQPSNGRITEYYISVVSSFEPPRNISVPVLGSTAMAKSVNDLIGGVEYRFEVRAKTSAGFGKSVVARQVHSGKTTLTMPVWAPPAPASPPEVLPKTVRSNDFSIQFSRASLSTRHGLLEKYAIVVAETDQLGRALPGPTNQTLVRGDSAIVAATGRSWQTWRQVHLRAEWPPYVALEKPLQRTRRMDALSPVTEVVGVDGSCAQRPLRSLCNGPLRPGRFYRVKLRAFSSPTLWTDSDYSAIVAMERQSDATALVVVSLLLAALLLAAVVLSAALLSRRGRSRLGSAMLSSVGAATDCLAKLGIDLPHASARGHHRRSRSLRERAGVDGRLERLATPAVGDAHRLGLPPPPTVVPSADYARSRPVRQVDFAEHVRLMSADSDFRFSEEYEDLKQAGRGQQCAAAELACNRNKNRFTNILPFDHSRVKLVPIDDEDGSDFINASYVSGYRSPREFIAAQGPLPSTVDDFWRMVWEQQSPAVVNLTRCVEKGREKCFQYWPDASEHATYGNVEVTLMNETIQPEWTVREFRLTELETGAVRSLRQLHFVAWPDFGVPDKPHVLVQFVRAFRVHCRPGAAAAGPTVVHCSAGVGRSGTFIAVDSLLQSAADGAPLDAFGMVQQMRHERVWMVQTEQQYVCVHHCLLSVLNSRAESVPQPRSAGVGGGGRQDVPAVVVLPPRVHQNAGFEDDEGIAESGV